MIAPHNTSNFQSNWEGNVTYSFESTMQKKSLSPMMMVSFPLGILMLMSDSTLGDILSVPQVKVPLDILATISSSCVDVDGSPTISTS